MLPARRFVPAAAAAGRWYASSPLALAREPSAPSQAEWTLLAGGDVLMDRTEPAGVDPFAGIEPPLASGDVAVVNVEMAITDRGTPSGKEFVFRAPSSAAQRIADAGIDVASLANNHAMDYGAVGLMDTVALLEDAGVVALGAGANDAEAFRHRIVEIDGDVTVAFVGVSRIVPWGFPAGPDKPGIASDTEPERVLESVRVASGEADVVVAVVHYQTGYAIDVTAEGYGINEFKHSEAYAWLAADDFLQARKHGFIPSYPAGIENQGPDPEPWEYVYIGTDNLTTPG